MSAARRQTPRGRAAVAEARLWLGTPYRHQGARRGAGCDCLGLIRGVWCALYGAEPEAVPPYSRDWSEVAREERLLSAALRHLHPVPLGRADTGLGGDVLLFRMRSGAVAKHLGIQTGPHKFIHAYSRHGVVESALSAPWSRRIVARFQFPEEDI